MRGVYPVAVLFERRARCVERLRGPAQVARDERDLGLGDDAPRAGHGLFRTERARRGGDQRVHRNPVTLVTPTCTKPGPNLSHGQQPPGEKHMIGTREEWLAARLDPLKAGEELTRRSGEAPRGG